MTPRTRTIARVATAAALVVVAAATAPSAYARWIFHDAAIGEAFVAPPGGTRHETCRDRLRATAGYGSFVEIEDGFPEPASLPAQAFQRVGYEVWKPPPGFTSFSSAFEDEDGVYFEDDQGGVHPAILVGSTTTRARTLLPEPVPDRGDPGVSDNYVFTSAPIRIDLDGVHSGDLLALAPASGAGGIFGTVRAINCTLPVLDVRASLLPGSAANVVRPHDDDDLLPVRVFGSKRVKVRHITDIHLGEAGAASVGSTRDLDGDGRPDRTYVFEQGDTGIQCIDTGVKVTGRTSDKVRFQVRAPVTTTGCAG